MFSYKLNDNISPLFVLLLKIMENRLKSVKLVLSPPFFPYFNISYFEHCFLLFMKNFINTLLTVIISYFQGIQE